ncbi:MAG: FeoB small GTPase domain-containing protein [Gemmataceae bacterium]
MTSPSPAAVPPSAASPARRPVVALLGNPNTGKTTLFNALSGLNHRVGNYPGVTVESKKGHMVCAGRHFELIDLPGTYSLAPRSPDEMVTVNIILGHQEGETRPDVVVCIVDASNLERNLYLTTQALELGVPVIIALNMIDVPTPRASRSTYRRWPNGWCAGGVDPGERRRGLDELGKAVAQAVGGARRGTQRFSAVRARDRRAGRRSR